MNIKGVLVVENLQRIASDDNLVEVYASVHMGVQTAAKPAVHMGDEIVFVAQKTRDGEAPVRIGQKLTVTISDEH